MHRAIICAGGLALAACNSVPTGASVAPGQLGNGGFAFECDDSVACDRYSHTAKTFPDAVALGSTFRVRYVAKGSSDATSVTVGSVGDWFTPALRGLSAQKKGWGTFVARDNAGKILDFVTVPVVSADQIVVYDAAYVGDTPTRVTSVKLGVGDTKSFRALARRGTDDLAGMLAYDWSAPATGVVQIDAQASGKVAITGIGAGTTRVTVEGASYKQTLDVEVTP